MVHTMATLPPLRAFPIRCSIKMLFQHIKKITLLFYDTILQFTIHHIFYSLIQYIKIIYTNIKITLKKPTIYKFTKKKKTHHPHHNLQPTPTTNTHERPTSHLTTVHHPTTHRQGHQNYHIKTPHKHPKSNPTHQNTTTRTKSIAYLLFKKKKKTQKTQPKQPHPTHPPTTAATNPSIETHPQVDPPTIEFTHQNPPPPIRPSPSQPTHH